MNRPPPNPRTTLAFMGLLILCVFPFISPPIALGLGAVVGLVIGNPFPSTVARWSKKLLQISVIGLGFGITASQIGTVGASAALYTAIGISLTFIVGLVLIKLITQEKNTAILITTGTAICGGSAIAAMAPAIKAKDHSISVALATVFTLNAIGLLIYPPIGHALGLSQGEFGVWAAMGIHDTSSVVGACETYGDGALAVGTIVKLTRALWIIPLAFIAAFAMRSQGKAKLPWFLAGFVIAAMLRSFVPEIELADGITQWQFLYLLAKQSLVVTIFLIGAGLTREVLAKVGYRPMLLGILLWVVASVVSLIAIRAGVIPIPAIHP